jgi:hypothetical protein
VLAAGSAEIVVDQPTTAPPPDSEDQDYVFRAQIALTEALAKYGKYFSLVVVGVLVAALAWGLYSNWAEKSRKADFEKIAAIDYLMPEPDPMSMYGLAPADDPNDTTRMANLAEGARRYEAAAAELSGTAATLARLRAMEAWTRAGKTEEASAAAARLSASGTTLADFVADTTRVRALLDAQKGDEAEAALREMSSRYSDFYAEQSLIRLANVQVGAGKMEAAVTTFAEIQKRFPTTTDFTALSELAGRLGQKAPADPALVVPAPGELPATGEK